MANEVAKRDDNHVPVNMGISESSGAIRMLRTSESGDTITVAVSSVGSATFKGSLLWKELF